MEGGKKYCQSNNQIFFIGNYENVTVVAVDRAGNQARCHFQVSIKPQPCVDWELKKPAYGDINCIPRGLGTSLDGYECIATCETGFRLVFFFIFYHYSM